MEDSISTHLDGKRSKIKIYIGFNSILNSLTYHFLFQHCMLGNYGTNVDVCGCASKYIQVYRRSGSVHLACGVQ